MPHLTGVVSDRNSSETPLGGAGVFTGVQDNVSEYATITVFMDSDQDGSCSMELSADAINWDRKKIVPITTEIGSGSVHTLEVVSRFFRIVYTNGSVAQTHFRLQAIYHLHRSGFLTSSPDEVISKINDAQIVRVSNDPELDISRNLYADKYDVHVDAYNGTIPNGSFGDVWSYGPTADLIFAATDETFRIKSGGNVADTAAGAGARSVFILFLNSVGDRVTEELATAGASASSATSVTGRRILHAWVGDTGADCVTNTGQIIIENSSTNQIIAVIEAGVGETESSLYTVPKDHTAYLERVHIHVAIGTNKDCAVKMWQCRGAYTDSAPFGAKRLVRNWTDIQGEDTVSYRSRISFPALTDIWLEAQGNGATSQIDVDYDLVLVKDDAPTTPQ